MRLSPIIKLECIRPSEIPYTYTAQGPNTHWAYGRCGHVVHQFERVELAGQVLRNTPSPRFSLWDRTLGLGRVRGICSECTLRTFEDVLIACAMCGAEIGLDYHVCVQNYLGGTRRNPFWQYATHLPVSRQSVVTCTLSRCCFTTPLFSGKWEGDGILVGERASRVRPRPPGIVLI